MIDRFLIWSDLSGQALKGVFAGAVAITVAVTLSLWLLASLLVGTYVILGRLADWIG